MFAKSNLFLVLICLLGTLFPLEINAQEEGNGGGKLTVHAIIAGTILIITGIIFCFLGKRLYRPTLYLTGFYLGSFSAWAALANGKPANGYAGAASDTIILAVSLAVGLFVGLLFLYFTNSAIWSLGALFGQISALFILAWASDGVIHNKIGRIALIMIMTNLGLLLTYLRRNASIMLGTAFVGAYAMILGIDLFVRTGFAQSISAFMDAAHGVSYETNTRVYLTLGGTIAWFIIGLIFQLKFNNTIHFGPVVEPEPEPEAGKKERMSTAGSIA